MSKVWLTASRIPSPARISTDFGHWLLKLQPSRTRHALFRASSGSPHLCRVLLRTATASPSDTQALRRWSVPLPHVLQHASASTFASNRDLSTSQLTNHGRYQPWLLRAQERRSPVASTSNVGGTAAAGKRRMPLRCGLQGTQLKEWNSYNGGWSSSARLDDQDDGALGIRHAPDLHQDTANSIAERCFHTNETYLISELPDGWTNTYLEHSKHTVSVSLNFWLCLHALTSGHAFGVLSLGVLTLSRLSLGHTDPFGAAPWALIPLFLSRMGLAPPLALSLAWASRPLFLLLSRGPCVPSLCACGPCTPPPPPFSRGLCSHIRALHSWCRTTFSWPLSRSWHPLHAQKASCVCLTWVSLSICVMGVKMTVWVSKL